MAVMSTYLANHLLDHSLGKTSFTKPATVAACLTTTTPTAASTGATIVEATYTGYTRATMTAASIGSINSGSAWSGVFPDIVSMGGAHRTQWGACTAGTSTVQSWAICDSSTTAAGNMLFFGTTTSQVVAAGT